MTGKDRSEQIAKEITARIVEELKKGVAPWEKPWTTSRRRAFNGVNGKPYRGMNSLLLDMDAMNKGYTLNCWLTFNQVRKMGGTVNKGEKASPVVFFKPIQTTQKDEEGNDENRIIRLLRFYFVFNIDQTDGLEKLREKYGKTANEVKIDPHAEAERIIRETGSVITHADIDRACYNREKDVITIPPRNLFKTQERYYAIALHELTHNAASRIMPSHHQTHRFPA